MNNTGYERVVSLLIFLQGPEISQGLSHVSVDRADHLLQTVYCIRLYGVQCVICNSDQIGHNQLHQRDPF